MHLFEKVEYTSRVPSRDGGPRSATGLSRGNGDEDRHGTRLRDGLGGTCCGREPGACPVADGGLTRVSHHPRVLRHRFAGRHADRAVDRHQARRRGGTAAGAPLVEGHGGAGGGRRGVRDRVVLRDGPAVAGTDGAVWGDHRHPVPGRGDLLLPGSDLSGRIPVRVAAAVPVGPLVERRADGGGGHTRRPLGDRGELLDELTRRIHAQPRQDHQSGPAVGLFQRLDPV